MKLMAASSMSTSTDGRRTMSATMPALRAPRMSDKSFERARQGRRRRRVLRAAIDNVTPMSLIGTFETWRPALTMSVSGSSRPTTKMTRLTLLGLDRLPYASTRSISEICIRRCEPVHICPARLVPPTSGALQRGREKCVPSFLSSPRLRPSSQLA